MFDLLIWFSDEYCQAPMLPLTSGQSLPAGAQHVCANVIVGAAAAAMAMNAAAAV